MSLRDIRDNAIPSVSPEDMVGAMSGYKLSDVSEIQ